MRVLVTGANGQLGRELQKVSTDFPNIQFKFLDKEALDITDENRTMEHVSEFTPEYIINAAAYTAVDKAEEHSELAYLINETGTKNLALAAKENSSWLFHISSDYVYHSVADRPLKETDETLPQGVYAKSKLAGEKAVIDSGCAYSILRTSWVYSSFGSNFVKTMLRLGREKERLNIVADQIGAPTYAEDLANHLIQMILKLDSGPADKTKFVGTFNIAGDGKTHWADFARMIFKIANISGCEVGETTTESYNAAAPRPLNSVLDMSKTRQIWQITCPDWVDALSRCLAQMKEVNE